MGFFIFRIRGLRDDDREKLENWRYLETEFLASVGLLTGILGFMSAVVIWSWGIGILVKGVLSFTFFYFTRTHIKKGFAKLINTVDRILTRLTSNPPKKSPKPSPSQEEQPSSAQTLE